MATNCDRRFINFLRHLARFQGQTVTIFTTSGGESGRGFTGVLIRVNCNFVRLLSDIGPAPSCALGSCCDVRDRRRFRENDFSDDELDNISDESFEENDLRNDRFNRIDCRFRRTGAVVDIPVERIASFVHNAV
jgi:hypothetical protein